MKVFRRKDRDGKEMENYYCNFTVNGRQVIRSMDTRDKVDATKKMLALRDEMLYGRPESAKAEGMEWKAFREKFYAMLPGRRKPNGVIRDHIAVTALENSFKHISPALVLQNVIQITPNLLTKMAEYRRDKEQCMASTIIREQGSLKQMMKWAEVEGIVSKQDWKEVWHPKEGKREKKAHKPEELDLIMERAHETWRTIVVLEAMAGLRRDEARHLLWSDVDIDRGIIHVQAKPEMRDPFDGSLCPAWEPKGGHERKVPMLPPRFFNLDVREYLLSIRPKNARGFVIADERGWRPTLGSMTGYLLRITRNAGLKGGNHALRHTFCSVCINLGVRPTMVQDWAGHTDLKTTMGYYRPDQDYRTEIARVVNRADLGNRGSTDGPRLLN